MAPSRGMLALLAGVTAAVLLLGWRLKETCLGQPWGNGFEYSHFCYSDLQVLYHYRVNGGVDVPFPYSGVEGQPGFMEYPVLTGLLMYVAAVATDGLGAYVAVQAVVLALFALGATLAVACLAPPRQALWWAAAPALAMYAFYSWDLLAVGFCAAALLAYRKERFLLAGLLLGLGASAKLYPAFLMPALGLALVARDRGLGRAGWALGLGFVGAWLAANVPFMLLHFDGWWDTYAWQMARGPNLESPYYVLGHLARHNGLTIVEPLSMASAASTVNGVLFLASLGVSGWLAFTRRLEPLAAAAIPVFAFLAFNKVQSVQYVLWSLPFLAILPLRNSQRAAVVAADLAVLVSLFTFFAVDPKVHDTALYLPVAIAVLLRCGAYTWIINSLVSAGLHKATPPPSARPSAAAPAAAKPPAARQP